MRTENNEVRHLNTMLLYVTVHVMSFLCACMPCTLSSRHTHAQIIVSLCTCTVHVHHGLAHIHATIRAETCSLRSTGIQVQYMHCMQSLSEIQCTRNTYMYMYTVGAITGLNNVFYWQMQTIYKLF